MNGVVLDVLDVPINALGRFDSIVVSAFNVRYI